MRPRALVTLAALLAGAAAALPVPAAAADQAPAGLFGGAASDVATLGGTRGTANPFDAAAALPASTVGENTVNYIGTTVSVNQNALINNSFNNAQGVFTVVQNAGNNVLIQNATSITINLY